MFRRHSDNVPPALMHPSAAIADPRASSRPAPPPTLSTFLGTVQGPYLMSQRMQAFHLAAVLGLSLCPITARGETLVSNLGNDPGAFSPVSITNDTSWAQQFTSGEAA